MITLASLLNFGGPDMLIILVIVLILFGAKKLPELAKGMGQALKEFTKAKNEFENEVTKPVAEIMVQRPAEQQPHYADQTRPAAQPQPVPPTVTPEPAHVAPEPAHVAPEPVPASKTQA